jgi:hypothetical protein
MNHEQPMNEIPFDQSELSNIATMATLMIVAGVITILSAVVGIAGAVVGVAVAPGGAMGEVAGNMCGALLGALASLALGVWLIVGGNAFKRVVQTDEADQTHLATGLRQLRNVFLLKSVLIILAICLVCVLAIAGAAFAGMSAPGPSY